MMRCFSVLFYFVLSEHNNHTLILLLCITMKNQLFFTIFHFGIAIFLVKSRTSLTAFANTKSKSYFVKSGTNVNASFQISTRTSLSCVLSIISHIGDLGRCWSRFWSRCWCRCWFLIVCIKGIELLGVIFLVFIIKENV